MIPIRLTLRNFLSYVDPKPLDFSGFDLAVLSGENGVGKSSILEALTWAVWEKTRAASSDDLIHQGASEMWVDFTFEHEGLIYRIFRRRDKRKQGVSTLEFQIQEKKHKNLLDDSGWKSIAESTLRVTQEKIINVLKLPYEIFTNSSYLRQGKADEFTVKTPSERKEILGEILGLGDWDKLEEKAKEKIKNFENETQAINFQLEDIKSQIAQKENRKKEFKSVLKEKTIIRKELTAKELEFTKIDSQKKKKEAIEEKMENLRNRLEEIAEEFKNLQLEKKENDPQIKNYESAIYHKKEINAKFNKLRVLQKTLPEIEKKQNRFLELREKLIYLTHQREELAKKTTKIQNISTCPTCLRPLKDKEAKDIIHHLEVEFKKECGTKTKEIEDKIRNLGYNTEGHQKIKEEIQKLLTIEDEKRHLDIAENTLENLKSLNQKIDLNIKNKLIQRQKIIKEGLAFKKEGESFRGIEVKWQEIETAIRTKREKLIEIESNFGALKQALKEIESKEEELSKKEKRLQKIGEEKSVYQELAFAFSKKGIQAMIIERAIPAIEEEANEILRRASDGKLALRFITQKAKKTAEEELIETLEIKIADAFGERNYEMYSGGEAFRINFAVRVALSKFLASRSGMHLKFLVMDEGFGTLDVAGREDLVETINSIRKDFEKIIIITHIQELKDLFPTQILVTKDEKGSHIEVIG